MGSEKLVVGLADPKVQTSDDLSLVAMTPLHPTRGPDGGRIQELLEDARMGKVMPKIERGRSILGDASSASIVALAHTWMWLPNVEIEYTQTRLI